MNSLTIDHHIDGIADIAVPEPFGSNAAFGYLFSWF
jgi:hypothetical protein